MKQIDLFDSNKEYIEKFIDMKIEDIFAQRFANYSKYIIQDRALPDVRDGLKPVQRRILYAMYKEGNLFNKQYRKSAKTVGNVIGNYHPHGDTSVYDAMVRMSQSWKVNEELIIMHGNNGSIDGDSAAAMRYTEAKMSEYSEELINDINLDSVDMVPNFDDTEFEPVVLPTKIPNLLVNGASGISAGYATDIPPHNIVEVLKAAKYVNENYGDANLTSIMKFIKGPDFPTGAIIQGKKEIKKAYETGKGKISIKSKIEIENDTIIVKELPYDVNKAVLLQKIELIKHEKKVEGIAEIIDQSAQSFIEINIKCTKTADPNIILSYLLKNTDLQKNYNFNMIAIDKRRPKQLGLVQIMKSFVDHRRDVVIRRSEFQLKKVNARLHLTEGIKMAIEQLDSVINIIRSSNDKKNAKENIISEFGFTEMQAEAVVNMQLYRLTNTDIKTLEDEINELINKKEKLENILNDSYVLQRLITEEINEVLKKFKEKRKSKIEDEIEKIEFSKIDLIKEENVIVTLSKKGYIKRSTTRSYAATDIHVEYPENDKLIKAKKVTTKDKLYIVFNDGTYIILPVYEINDIKWKDIGKHISSIAKINDGVEAITWYTENEIKENKFITISNEGYCNIINGYDFIVSKEKNKIIYQKLKKDDEIADFRIANKENLIVIYSNDEYIGFKLSNLEVQNIKRMGKKVSRLKKNQKILKVANFSEHLVAITDKGGYIKISREEFKYDEKYHLLFENVKSNNHTIVETFEDEEVIINLSNENLKVDLNKLEKTKVEDKVKVIKRGLIIEDININIKL